MRVGFPVASTWRREATGTSPSAAGARPSTGTFPRASHASALRTDPGGYERHVVGFLDRALRG